MIGFIRETRHDSAQVFLCPEDVAVGDDCGFASAVFAWLILK